MSLFNLDLKRPQPCSDAKQHKNSPTYDLDITHLQGFPNDHSCILRQKNFPTTFSSIANYPHHPPSFHEWYTISLHSMEAQIEGRTNN